MKALDILNPVKNFVRFLFAHFFEIFSDLLSARGSIPANDLMKDTLSTLLSAGMMLVFNLVALVVFLFLPQGQDVLLIVSEDITGGEAGSLVWLAFGTVIWSLFSEFGMRYAIYVTDNSGSSLSEARVNWRRKLQVVVSDIFIILPFLIVILGMIFNRPISDVVANAKNWYIGLWAPVVLLYLLMTGVSHIYFTRKKATEGADKKTADKPVPLPDTGKDNEVDKYAEEAKNNADDKAKEAPENGFLSWLREFILISGREKDWCEKLTGIYNPYIFLLPKSANFKNEVKDSYVSFEQKFLRLPEEERNLFPQNTEYVEQCAVVPKEFALIKYTEDYIAEKNSSGKKEWKVKDENCNGRYRWVYFIPNSFYHKLHRMLYLIVGISLVFLFLMLVFPVTYYKNIGAPGLLVLAFASWIGIYIGILYVDYAIFRKGPPLVPGMPYREGPGNKKYREAVYAKGTGWSGVLSLRFFFLVMLIISSASNDDHPVRFNQQAHCDTRPDMVTHFNKWFTHYRQYARIFRDTSDASDTGYFYPVVFVCAEGGALRTGAYTSMMLGLMQDSLKQYGVDFKSTVYAYSGISGGSLGLAFFSTIAYMDKEHPASYSYREQGREFFNTDYLAAVIARLCYSEIVQLVLPWHIEKFDRAIALEKNWEAGYEDLGTYNYFSTDYLTLWDRVRRDKGDSVGPALFINTTEAETGLQCWLTNVRPDSSMYYYQERDLFHHKIKGGINYSTMINFSTRFPLLSPGACLVQSPAHKLHYVDGGYVENTGSATMTEILRCLGPAMDTFRKHGYDIRPFVLTLRFGEDATHTSEIDLGNEITEVLNGIYNVRGGRVKMAEQELKSIVAERKGTVVALKLARDINQVPMNWVLSERSLNNLDQFVNETWKNRQKNCLSELYCINKKYDSVPHKIIVKQGTPGQPSGIAGP